MAAARFRLMPNYLVSVSDDAVVLRNYEGMLIRYQAEDKPGSIRPVKTRGVSSLLEGGKTVLLPEDNERMARRRMSLQMVNDHFDQGYEHPVEELVSY